MAKKATQLEQIGEGFDDAIETLVSRSIPKKYLQATHRGNFQDILGVDVECFVLNDKDKTVVLSKGGMSKALKMTYGGDRITRLVNRKQLAKYESAQKLSKKLDNPLLVKGLEPAQKPEIHGYDILVLADVCDLIIDAYNDGVSIDKELYNQSRVLQKSTQKLGWKSLGWAVAGYKPHEEEVIRSFQQYLVEENTRQYSKEFPVELYIEWSNLYGFPLKVGRNNHIKCRWLTIQHVYEPLLRSNGRLLSMLRKAKLDDPEGKHKKLFQYLNDELGMPAIRKHLTQLQTIAEVADNLEEYEKNFNKLFGIQLQFDFTFDDFED